MLPIANETALVIRQRKELAELVGFETRNKYEIRSNTNQVIGFAAEQGSGLLGVLGRHFFGHWRPFEIHVFNNARQLALVARHPFRFFFQRLEVSDAQGQPIGALQQRFSLFSKKFDLEDARGQTLMRVSAPFWKIWTFPFYRDGHEVATVKKRWSGLLKEVFLDADNFLVEFEDQSLGEVERLLVMVAGIFVDLLYFEEKASDG